MNRCQRTMTKTDPSAIRSEYWFTEEILVAYDDHFPRKSGGTSPMFRPRKSLTCEENMMSAMPLVNPTTTGYGMNLIAEPNRATPMMMRATPAMIVAMASPSSP